MSRRNGQVNSKQAGKYAINITELLDRRWTGALPEMEFSMVPMPDGTLETRIVAQIPDQAALRGYLCKLWDLGLTITRLERLDSGKAERSN